jgi:crotonobetainyl-CoA:carnitine CoA-transferase CaiB-like acyl-CoA transferase
LEAALRLAGSADVVVQNFKPGSLAKLGLDYATLRQSNPGLVYVNHTGFLPGPYEHRSALDEVVQMMGGLAYMTGRSGDPLRAGASVNDIMGGMFGAIGALAALMQRNQTGQGQEIDSALFENNVFLVAQHMMQFAVTGQPAAPMPERIHSWGVYDIFTSGDGEQVFLAAVSDPQWVRLCTVFGFDDLLHDEGLRSNNDRVRARERMIPQLRERFGRLDAATLADRFEAEGLPFARIEKPEDLLHDPHLLASGGLQPMKLPDGERAGEEALVALLPLRMGGERLGVRADAPRFAAHTMEVLQSVGYTVSEVESMADSGAVATAQ